jgi:hypothetical protein
MQNESHLNIIVQSVNFVLRNFIECTHLYAEQQKNKEVLSLQTASLKIAAVMQAEQI